MPEKGPRLEAVCFLLALLVLCAWLVRMAFLSLPWPHPVRLP